MPLYCTSMRKGLFIAIYDVKLIFYINHTKIGALNILKVDVFCAENQDFASAEYQFA